MNEGERQTVLRLSDSQNRIVAATLTFLCVTALAVGVVMLVWFSLRAMGYFLHIVGPVIVAYYLSLLTRPWYALLKRWFRGHDAPALIAFSLSILIPIVLLVSFFGAFLYEQARGLLTVLPELFERWRATLIEHFPALREVVQRVLPALPELVSSQGPNVAKIAEGVANTGLTMGGMLLASGGVILAAGTKAALWLLTFFYWILFMMRRPLDGAALARRVPFVGERGRRLVADHFRTFNEIVVSYFRGQMIDVTLQGLLYGAGFQLIGMPNGFAIGFMTGLLNLMPYIGSTLGLCVALPVAFMAGGFWLAAAAVGIFTCVQTFDGYVMQPYIQGDRMKLAAWQIVFALLFWTQVGGFLGLLLAIPLTAFIKASWGGWCEWSERFVGAEAKAEACKGGRHG